MTPSKRITPRSAPARTAPAFVPPYPPSWVDRLFAAIDRLPGPYWAPYALAFLAFLVLLWLLLWREGRPLTLEAVYSDSIPFYGFWLIHYLDRRAAASLQSLRPAFTGSETKLQEVHWRLTTIPAAPALLISLASLLLGIVSSLGWERGSPPQFLGTLAYYATMVFAGLYAYHTIRQLRLVTLVYAEWARVDLHNVAPLYAFSTLSAHTAMGMLLILAGAVLITPGQIFGLFLVGALFYGALAVLTFLLPLAGVHRRLAEEKEQAQVENARRWQACTTELYHLVDRGDWPGTDRLNATLTALERTRNAIERIPTWPWRPETLRGLVAALLLPIVIWLVQFGLQRLLG